MVFIIVETYQATAVLKILKSGQVYRAGKSLKYDRAYQCLIDMLKLNCQCPIFGCLKYYKKCANGRVSSSVKLVLDVPAKYVKLTEYSTWADFIYFLQFTRLGNYQKIENDCTEITQNKFSRIIYSLKTQRPPSEYRVPQVVLEEIRPEWLIEERNLHFSAIAGRMEKLFSIINKNRKGE